MKRKRIVFWIILIILPLIAKPQVSLHFQAGVSYIEHISTGLTINFDDKDQVSLLYGTNLFIKTNDFVSYMVGYERAFTSWQLAGFKPKLGIKGGYAIYTDIYYSWKLVQVVLCIGSEYSITKKLNLLIEAGVAISRELSLERINYSEIGNYRTYLPEFKIGLAYKLF